MQNPYSNSGWYGSDQQQQQMYANTSYGQGNAYPFIQRRRRRGCISCLVTLVVLIGVAGAGVGIFFAVTGGNNPLTSLITNSGTQVYERTVISSNTHPNIVINNSTGFVRVHAGSAANQILAEVIGGSNDSGETSLPYTRGSDGQTITIDAGNIIDGTLDLTVPATSDLKIDTDGIDVVGIRGQMSLTSPAGPITITQSRLTGTSKLDNNGGPIFAIQDMLIGNVTFSNNGGVITFSGSIAPNGKYTFDSNGSMVDVTLPATSSFHLDVTGNIDTFTTDFPGIPTSNSFPGADEIHTNVGHDYSATMTISLNGGPAVLHKQ
jgi:hypothetical protein